MRAFTIATAAAALLSSVLSFEPATAQVPSSDQPGVVAIRGRELLRDGRPWIPHGFYQIAFEVAPANLPRADHPFWATAQADYTPLEYAAMRSAGADSVRIQISQAGADPRSPQFDAGFVTKAIGAVRAARAAGLTVIVCVQAETHVPQVVPIALPDDGTRRVWRELAPRFADDRGIMLELLNEPRPNPSPRNWRRWKGAMTSTLRVVRSAGAENVVIADGLRVGQVLAGAPLLEDGQVAYASHPYALDQLGQTPRAWNGKFGTFSRRAPVIITEWLSGGYFCNGDTARSTVRFVQYLQDHHVGLEMGIWDWPPLGFGSVRQGFPNAQFSSFADRSCHQPLYGSGNTIEAWYRTGVPPARPS